MLIQEKENELLSLSEVVLKLYNEKELLQCKHHSLVTSSQIIEQEYESDLNINGKEVENTFLRRLLQIMRLPVINLKSGNENKGITCRSCFKKFKHTTLK